ncbi:MAG: transglutaminase-like cysteine peptidase [Desulfovibrio sp.]|nr:transglutaminase-like cysteine peptidase [Desulfovibrio sp.]
MPTQDAGTVARTGTPATPGVRGVVTAAARDAGEPARDVAGADTTVQATRTAADTPDTPDTPDRPDRPDVADVAGVADVPDVPDVSDRPDVPPPTPKVNGADAADGKGTSPVSTDAVDTAPVGTSPVGTSPVGPPDAPLVAQAEQAGQTGQAGQAGQARSAGQAAQPRQPGQPGQSEQAAEAAQPAQPAQPVQPRQGASSASRGIRLFNTIEFRGPLKNLPKWDRVLNVDRKTPGLIPERALGGRNALWGELRSEWRGLSTMDKLRNVNSLFNQWPYRLDSEVWGVVDYWAAPIEFLRKSGDCEDYAITKYFALKQLGVPVSDMRIVILLDSIRRLAHAILVVYTGGDAYVLDNLSNVVLSHQRYGHYVPQYSINEEYRWAHIPIRGGPGTRRMQ